MTCFGWVKSACPTGSSVKVKHNAETPVHKTFYCIAVALKLYLKTSIYILINIYTLLECQTPHSHFLVRQSQGCSVTKAHCVWPFTSGTKKTKATPQEDITLWSHTIRLPLPARHTHRGRFVPALRHWKPAGEQACACSRVRHATSLPRGPLQHANHGRTLIKPPRDPQLPIFHYPWGQMGVLIGVKLREIGFSTPPFKGNSTNPHHNKGARKNESTWGSAQTGNSME